MAKEKEEFLVKDNPLSKNIEECNVFQSSNNEDLDASRKVLDEMNEVYDRLSGLDKSLGEIAFILEKARLNEYAAILCSPKLLFRRNLVAGVIRGVGFAIGFTILGALVLYILNLLVDSNLPLIGDFIAELMNYVEEIRNIKY